MADETLWVTFFSRSFFHAESEGKEGKEEGGQREFPANLSRCMNDLCERIECFGEIAACFCISD